MSRVPKADKGGGSVMWDVSPGASSLVKLVPSRHLSLLFIHRVILGRPPSTEQNSQQREEEMFAFAEVDSIRISACNIRVQGPPVLIEKLAWGLLLESPSP